MNRAIIVLLFLFLNLGCVSTPKIKYTRLDTNFANSANFETNGTEILLGLVKEMSGAQFGDQLFSKGTSAYWIIPEIDKLDLDITARKEHFSQEEYQRRLEDLSDLHKKYLVFLIDLKVPFNPDWPQQRLIDFFKTNLVTSLENGTGNIYFPKRRKFEAIEQFESEERKGALLENKEDLEVRIPLRLLFDRDNDSDPVITPSTKEIVLKLGLNKNPPYKIGYFDEKFFQGYRWKIVRD